MINLQYGDETETAPKSKESKCLKYASEMLEEIVTSSCTPNNVIISSSGSAEAPSSKEFSSETPEQAAVPMPSGRMVKRRNLYNKRRKTVAFNFDEEIETKESAVNLSGILKQSKVPRWNGITVKSGNPWRCHQIYLNAARLGSKIPRLNALKETLN